MTKENSLVRYNAWMKTANDESFNTSVRNRAKENAELVLKRYPGLTAKAVEVKTTGKR